MSYMEICNSHLTFTWKRTASEEWVFMIGVTMDLDTAGDKKHYLDVIGGLHFLCGRDFSDSVERSDLIVRKGPSLEFSCWFIGLNKYFCHCDRIPYLCGLPNGTEEAAYGTNPSSVGGHLGVLCLCRTRVAAAWGTWSVWLSRFTVRQSFWSLQIAPWSMRRKFRVVRVSNTPISCSTIRNRRTRAGC